MPHRTLQEEERSLWTLFGTFFKIGLFTFGGGYAMIALLEDEFITKKHWLGRDEFLDMAAIAESTPGPVAINSATYLGYKLAGVPGAAVATVAVSLPSFGIIYAISLFFDQFTSLTVVAHAFQGIQLLGGRPDAQGAGAHAPQCGHPAGGHGLHDRVLSAGGQVLLHRVHPPQRHGGRGRLGNGQKSERREVSGMLWQLFWTFLEIGAVSFGGGYGMISLIREKVLLHGWLEETQFLSFIAVSESTPGPLAINMATFIGASQAGAAGAFCATLGVVLPSFFIILLIAALIHNLLQYAGVNAFLSGIRPCVVALILATAVTMGLSSLLGVSTLADTPAPAWQGIGILAALLLLHFGWQKWKGKAPSPIAMILVSAVLGMVVYH